MDLLWQINYEEMLSGLMVTTFLILLNASVVVVSSMVMFPLIDLAFKKKAKPAPRPAQVETWQSGRPWLALRSDFLRPDAVPHPPLPLVDMAHHALADPPLERITPLKVRSLVPKGSEGAPPGPGSSVKEWPDSSRGDHEDRRPRGLPLLLCSPGRPLPWGDYVAIR